MMIVPYSHSPLTSWHLNSGITMQAIDTTVYLREMRKDCHERNETYVVKRW